MLSFLSRMAVSVYFACAAGLLLYGVNCYVMIILFYRSRGRAAQRRREVQRSFPVSAASPELPRVTTQIPVFNEYNVVERVIRAACRMRYPADRHEIQILDDSTDETRQLIDRTAAELRRHGHDVRVLRRSHRRGYKAGALSRGMALAGGELLAVFDADFVPPADFLLQSVPFFLADAGLGLVQARWGHLNQHRSLLTRAQSIGIDGHFMVEQSARNWNGLFMNFNGTAGIWRRQAVQAAGGWQWDTLTEDMDLSYRVQFAGWRTVYLPDLVVPGEIPEDVRAFKSQQFRWAKGSIQTAKKLLPGLLRSQEPWFRKLQAVFHMTHYLVHPLMLVLALLALPVLLTVSFRLTPSVFGLAAVALGISMLAPSALYAVSQQAAYEHWGRHLLMLPLLVVIGIGIALSNTQAVFEALAGRPSEFVRTPKRGELTKKAYPLKLPAMALLEIMLGLYCTWSLAVYLSAGKYLVGPFLGAYAAGFLFIGLLSVVHTLAFSK